MRFEETLKLLPGFNCGVCGKPSCLLFAKALVENQTTLNHCKVLNQERFSGNLNQLQSILNKNQPGLKIKSSAVIYQKTKNEDSLNEENFTGLIDKIKADFLLHPLEGEPSCRETLVNLSGINIDKGAVIRYRPLGCPLTHFATVLEVNGNLIDVWVTGPPKLLNRDTTAIDLGICMVLSFVGTIEGQRPKVGQTVKFLPAHCMMGKVHSGVIVLLEADTARIDCIDLKVF